MRTGLINAGDVTEFEEYFGMAERMISASKPVIAQHCLALGKRYNNEGLIKYSGEVCLDRWPFSKGYY